jgi:hypothetical protein
MAHLTGMALWIKPNLGFFARIVFAAIFALTPIASGPVSAAAPPTRAGAPQAGVSDPNPRPWRISTVDLTPGKDMGQFSSLALDPVNGHPYVSYYNATDRDLRFAKYVGVGGNCGPSADWSCETVDSSGDVGKSSSIDAHYFPAQLPLRGRVAIGIAYYDADHSALKFSEYDCLLLNSCGWQTTTIGSADYYTGGRFVSLKYDQNGHPLIAYIADNTTYSMLNLASYLGNGGGNCGQDANHHNQWHCETVDMVAVSSFYLFDYPSLAIDSNNNPRIAYISYDVKPGQEWNGFLKFTYPVLTMGSCGVAQAWQCDTIYNMVHNTPVALVTDLSGKAHVAYHQDINGLAYSSQVGSGGNCGQNSVDWTCQSIDTLHWETNPNLPTNMGISMALDSQQREHILYYHPKDGGETMEGLFIAQYTWFGLKSNCGPSVNGHHLWTCTPVDPSPGMGKFASTAINANDLATVAYYDAVNKALKIASEVLPVYLPLVNR